MERRALLETHPLDSVRARRKAGDIRTVPLEEDLVGARDGRWNADVVIPPAPLGDDVGRLVASTEAGSLLGVVGV